MGKFHPLYITIFTLLVFSSFQNPKEFYIFVSPKGSDLNSGSITSPFRTIHKAKEVVRTLRSKASYSKITIYLREGVYQIDKPIIFSDADGGTDVCAIVYAAYKNENVIISGGKQITSKWIKIDNTRNIWKVTLPPSTPNVNQLFANGRRVDQSSSPMLFTAGPIDQYKNIINITVRNNFGESQNLKTKDLLPFCSFAYQSNDLDYLNKSDINNIEVILYQSWDCSWHTVSNIDKATRSVYLKSPAHFPVGLFSNINRYYVKNSSKDLKIDNWCYDKINKLLLFRSSNKQNPNAISFTYPTVDELIVIASDKGDAEKVKNLSFYNLNFMYTMSPRGFNIDSGFVRNSSKSSRLALDLKSGYTGNQAAYNCGQAIKIINSKGIQFSNCSFAHLGAYAINADKYSDTINIKNSAFYDLGGGGIVLGYYQTGAVGQGIPPSSTGNTIEYCQVHDIGKIHPSSVGIGIMNVNNSKISNNEIYNGGYSGISSGWVWGFGKSYTYANKIVHNKIHDVMRVLADGGGIYTLGKQTSTVIKGNKIYNIRRSKFAVGSFNNGVFFDEGSSDIMVDSNIIFNIQNQKMRFNKTDSTKLLWQRDSFK
ncbi:right-handed parallel beta-helix repeat-containing protein [Mucilaginibacter terrenus]|nr:right-handed parallel beta-helix repeat-containing protein [Mucilaginibacter terrenus]